MSRREADIVVVLLLLLWISEDVGVGLRAVTVKEADMMMMMIALISKVLPVAGEGGLREVLTPGYTVPATGKIEIQSQVVFLNSPNPIRSDGAFYLESTR